ncbi:hypothetical protein OSB04_029032 [Centaurea solstitialis]|uniref:Uncharacterized protein n=1 Tax=Centaurea solstitialis TaxID=347529 RepID=A0AA38WBS2_9ASTR|nr:hypothetical protein OSB04_029032 [Centaurea solstitialis]
MLLFSDTHHGDTPRLLYIYRRWVNSIYTIKGGFALLLLKHGPEVAFGTQIGCDKMGHASLYLSVELTFRGAFGTLDQTEQDVSGDGVGSFILKSSSFPPAAGGGGLEMVTKKSAKYSITLQYLVLEEIYQDEEEQKYHL